MQDEWWYSTGDARKGPVSIDTLRKMMIDGTLSASTLVWKEGLAEWTPLTDVADLGQVMRSVPPELPRPTERDQLISLPLAGPWRRFSARFIDLWFIALPLGFIVAYVISSFSPGFALWIQKPGSEYAFGWILTPLNLAVEAAIFGLFGTTLGKALLGVKVATVDAQRPSAGQYLYRQLGVYWYGLGTGFPLVSAFTMARQHGRLKAGKHARYDEGRFNVKAPKLGFLRAVVAITVVAALFFVNAGLRQMSRQSERGYLSGSTWTNDVTGKSVAVPRGWIYEKQQNDEKQPIHIFSGLDVGVYVVFAKEDVRPEVDLDTYVSAWIAAAKGTMTLSPASESISVNGHPGLRVVGNTADDRTQKVSATLVKKGRQVWRVVLLGTSGRIPTPPEALKLQELLFSSLE